MNQAERTEEERKEPAGTRAEASQDLEAQLGAHLQEVLADLPTRRLAVRAEILAAVVAELEALESCPLPELVSAAGRPGGPHLPAIESNLLRHAADILRTLEEVALTRGAGVPVPDGVDYPAHADREVVRPPATPDGLGHQELGGEGNGA